MAESFDVVVLGGGNAGYAAAFRARGLGLTVAMVERDKVGGTCLHRGCIPTKALLHAADLVDEIKHSGDFGIIVSEPEVDWGKVQSFKDSVVGRMYKGVSGLVRRNKVELVEGLGTFVGDRTISVRTGDGERILRAEAGLVLAPGSYPRDLPAVEADGDRIHNSDHGLVASDVPSSVVVCGGNYIGLEFASIYRSLGARVEVVEMLARIAPGEDLDISEALRKLLERRGIKFHLETAVTGAAPTADGIEVEVESGGQRRTISAERMLIAVGRGPRTGGMGLQESGVALERGFIVVDDELRTNLDGVYAIGDAVAIPGARWPHPQLAHVAYAEGMAVAERIAGAQPAAVDYVNIPHVIYCQPEVAAVGLTEQQAGELGIEVETRRYPFSANARALMLGGGQGFVKTIAAKGGEVVGVHMVGPRASDLISEAMLATSWEAYPDELAALVHPHPTLSEVVGETFLELAGRPLHG